LVAPIRRLGARPGVRARFNRLSGLDTLGKPSDSDRSLPPVRCPAMLSSRP
jgi:hypothetical protein